MKQFVTLCMALFTLITTQAQYSIQFSIQDKESKAPLPGATAIITGLNKTVIADSAGIVRFANLGAGSISILISYTGKQAKEIKLSLPLTNKEPLLVLLEEAEEEEEEIIVTATRSSRTISDLPTRVETISGEELTEKGNMKPGDIRMLLNESTGIQTQQTSATSYNSSIRIQGLDGRYTQLLRDGFPLYAGFAGGLSLMQVAPLDLKQIEVIKGSSSTLYGGGAIAGLVNLVSKVPSEERDLSFMSNFTSAGGVDLSGFYSQKFNKLGLTVFGSGNTGRAYDPANIGLTAIPEFKRYTLNPKLFVYGKKTTLTAGVSYIRENRTGGSMEYIKNGTPGYFEKNKTERFSTQLQLVHTINDQEQLSFKNSYNRFDRFIQIPSYAFKGLQQSTYSEATYTKNSEKVDWIVGLNIVTDDFTEDRQGPNSIRDYKYTTWGGFVQNTWTPSKFISIETGLRGDYVKQYGLELLPRISVMFKFSPALTARLGGGLGYKTPTVFNEESERIQFQNILPIDPNNTKNERSAGGNLDFNYRTSIGEVGISINQLFFYTRINKPLVISATVNGSYEFINANGHVDTRGTETNVRLSFNDFKLFMGYTYADVNTHFNNTKSWFPLTAKHRLNNVLMYEIEEKLKIGFEAYYFSEQKLTDGSFGKSYWTFGLMGEKLWEKFSIFLNLENITDTRQTRFDTIYIGSITAPSFRDIYAPVDGFVVNGGVKIRL